MTIVACPRCKDEVTAPPQTAGDALVRCPLCNEEYMLSEALRQAPPMLIVVSPGPSFGPAVAESELQLAPTTPAPKPFVFEERPAPRRVTARARPQRREKNVFAEAVKIIAGGAVGLTIGQLLLWWIPGLQLSQRDPLDLGPRIAVYAPWIVPMALRLPPIDEESLARELQAEWNESGQRSRSNPARPPSTGRLTHSDESTGADAAPDFPLDLGSERSSDPQSVVTAGVRSGPSISSDETSAALAEAQIAWEEVSSSENTDELRRAVEELARCLTFTDPLDEQAQGLAEAARSLVRDIATSDEYMAAISQPRARATPLSGRALIGTIESSGVAGDLYSCQLSTDAGTVNVVGVIDPRKFTTENNRVVILGVHVPDPGRQLVGYRGPEEPVVFGGLLINLPLQSSAVVNEQPTEPDASAPDSLETDPDDAPPQRTASEDDSERPPAPPEDEQSPSPE